MRTTIHDNGQEFTFPNGFESWHETHYQISAAIHSRQQGHPISGLVHDTQKGMGLAGLPALAVHLTNEFEQANEGREWDGEYFEAIETFVDSKNL
jgi:hypothetical protein